MPHPASGTYRTTDINLATLANTLGIDVQSAGSCNMQLAILLIMDDILSNLDDDNASLRACTFVCRAWCSFAQYHLLRTVVCRPDAPHLSLRELLSFSTSAPDLAAHVLSLKIIGGKSGSTPEIAVEDVTHLLSVLHNVGCLSLERVAPITRGRAQALPTKALPLLTELSTISLCALHHTDTIDSFFQILKNRRGTSPLRVILRFVHSDD
ncbi:hypothetical protein BD310DRAFT_925384 [Dichomitus squalens]|uniref:F-box domain-containing protein n=1 Tax=Dichomitus squalens TaxID=114155 RepID=A0A4Q9PXN4_9APHY|nr:hypothetical protein BD310DRAFT_925384 [Dichomitus squalens]